MICTQPRDTILLATSHADSAIGTLVVGDGYYSP
jgi:hypothetical protein